MDQFVQDQAYAGHFGEYRKILDRVINHDPAMFELPRDARIVDIGCGFGGLLGLLRERGYQCLIGIEPDAECRDGAVGQGIDVRAGTLMQTGLPDGSADAVIVNQVFHHISDYAAALSECHRVLRPGGLLCFMEPLNTVLRYAMDVLTFDVPLRKIAPPVETRYRVMKLEMDTGMYPQFLAQQDHFHAELNRRFEKIWHRRRWLFQFGKYRSR